MPVVLFHAGLSAASGGYVGVDVFFVISGYLISHIIVADARGEGFSLGRFYERRARRILPAFFAVCLATLPPAFLLLLPHQLKDFGQSLFASNLFISNIFFIFETDYFNEFAHYAPLLHTWSLSVEEQFYVLYPLVMVALLRWRTRASAPILVVATVAVASMALSLGVATQYPDANFYLMPTRAWQLLAGAIVALSEIEHGRVERPRVALLGLALIVGAVVGFTPQTPSPSLWSVIPVGGTVLVLLFGGQAGLAGRTLSLRPLQTIGLMSYSLYLVHQPVLAFARVSANGTLSPGIATLCVAATFFLGWLSWRAVEIPWRKVAWSRSRILTVGALGSLALAGGGYGLHKTKGLLEWQISQVEPERRVFVLDQEALSGARRRVWNRHLPNAATPYAQAEGRTKVLILGDSKAQDLYVTTVLHDSLFQRYAVRRLVLDDPCMAEAATALSSSSAATDRACSSDFFSAENRDLIVAAEVIVLTASWQAHTVREAESFARALAGIGKSVVIISTANFNDVPSVAMGLAKGRAPVSEANRYFFENIRSDWKNHSDALEQRVRGIAGVRYIEKLETFCSLQDRTCELFSPAGEAYIFDSGHVTLAGAARLAAEMSRSDWFRPVQ